MKYENNTVYIFAVLSVGAAIGVLSGKLSFLQAFSGFALAFILSAAYEIGIIEKMRSNWADSFSDPSPGSLANHISSSEAVEMVEDWAEERYVEGEKVDFRWSKDKFKSDVVHDEDGNPYLFYAFKTYYGEQGQGTLVFVEGIQFKDVIDHTPIEHDDMDKDPLWFCDMWRNMNDRKEKQILTGNLDYQYANSSGRSDADVQVLPMNSAKIDRMNNMERKSDSDD